MPVIACINQKGGVGKTSTCHHLAGALALDGRRVLLVDNDAQASLTQGLYGPDATRALDPARTVVALYRDGIATTLADVAQGTPIPGIDLVPGSAALAEWDLARPEEAPPGLRTCLRWGLAPAPTFYDWTLIDCPPRLNLCAWAALAAATHYLIPLQPEDYGAQGVRPVIDFAAAVREADNAGLCELGLLLTMRERLKLHDAYEIDLRGAYGALVLAQTVRRYEAFKSAIAARKPVSHHEPRSNAADDVRGLAEELARRLEAPGAPGEEVA